MLDTIENLVSYTRAVVEPFTAGLYVDDWERRSAIVSAISDYLLIRLRDDAFVEDDMARRPLELTADAGYRARLATSLRTFVVTETLQLPALSRAPDTDTAALYELCGTLDYSEKVVMSSAAYALVNLPLSLELFSIIGNIFFEEAYHLKIVSAMLGLDQATRVWLPPDKGTNWDLVRACPDGATYMLLEHVLFEARGAIAAARGVHDAVARGVSPASTEWLRKICNQETNHAITGLRWFHREDRRRTLSSASRGVVRNFIERECDDKSGSFRTRRQRYSSWLLTRYFDGAGMEDLIMDLKRDVSMCQHTGEIVPTAEDVSRATTALYAYANEAAS